MLSKKLHLGLHLSDNSKELPLSITKTDNYSTNTQQWKETEGLEWLHPQLDPYNPYLLHQIDFKDKGSFYFVKSSRGVMRHLNSDCLFIEKKKYLEEKAKFEKYQQIKFIAKFHRAKSLSLLVQFTKYKKKTAAQYAIESSLRVSYSKFVFNSIPIFLVRETKESNQTIHQCVVNVVESVLAEITQVKAQMQLLVDSESQNASKWLLTNVTIQKLVRLVEYVLIDHCVQFLIEEFTRIQEISFDIVQEDDLNCTVLSNLFDRLDIPFDMFKLNESDRLYSHAAISWEFIKQNEILKSIVAAWILAVENVELVIRDEKLKCITSLEQADISMSKFSELENVKIGKLNIRIQLFRSQWIRDFVENHPHLHQTQ